jgi:hypothetical protein
MWKAERKAGKGRGEASPKETYGRLRGRREGKRGGRSKRDIWKAEREVGREEGKQVQKRHVEG